MRDIRSEQCVIEDTKSNIKREFKSKQPEAAEQLIDKH